MRPFDPELIQLAARLGWAPRTTGTEHETCLGDYAHGYLLLERPDYIQLARRAEKGDPSLKVWSPDAGILQKYIAFNAAQLVRFAERIGPPVSLSVDPAVIAEPFRLVHDEAQNPFLLWTIDGVSGWAGVGVGNEFVAAQLSQYASRSVTQIIDDVLAHDAVDRFPHARAVPTPQPAPYSQDHRLLIERRPELVDLAARCLGVPRESVLANHHDLPEDEAFSTRMPVRGGNSLIVAADGSVLFANSSITSAQHLEAFRAGRRTDLAAFESRATTES